MRGIDRITEDDKQEMHDAIFEIHVKRKLAPWAVMYLLAIVSSEIMKGYDKAYEQLIKEQKLN